MTTRVDMARALLATYRDIGTDDALLGLLPCGVAPDSVVVVDRYGAPTDWEDSPWDNPADD